MLAVSRGGGLALRRVVGVGTQWRAEAVELST